jgi:beta-glucosidase
VIAGETYADAQVHLVWMQPEVDNSMQLKKEALAIAKKADVVIMCMGLNSHLEGEEMPVDLEGFRGGDRTKLALPAVQENLIKEVAALGTPVVLVLLNGSALAVNWEKDHIPAIVEAWYTGQAGGTAIADVLFGDYNPAGRLPVTFYKSVDDLPPFEDYAMAGHTYRYFTGETLYPFGYGLSYTTFSFADVKTKTDYKIGDTVTISATVKNTGSMAGDEVVQVYVSDRSASVPVPIRALKGFRRIHLNPGEAQRVEFALPPEDFSVINGDNNRVNHPGTFEISIGNGQPGGEGSTTRTAEITLR